MTDEQAREIIKRINDEIRATDGHCRKLTFTATKKIAERDRSIYFGKDIAFKRAIEIIKEVMGGRED